MPGQFDMQQNFPVASIADLAAQRPFKEQQMRAQQQQQLVQGLQGFSAGVDSLVQRRQAMAQALALSKLYGASPAGQAALGTNQVATSPTGAPVTQNQTAAYDPTTGSVTPNQPATAPSDVATALYGAKPDDILKNIAQQREQSQANAIEQGKLSLAQQIEPQKLGIEKQKVGLEQQIQTLLTGIKGQEAGTEATRVANQETDALRTRRDTLIKNLSLLPDWLNPAGAESQKEIDAIDTELAKRGQGPGPKKTVNPTSQKFQTNNGTSYSVVESTNR